MTDAEEALRSLMLVNGQTLQELVSEMERFRSMLLGMLIALTGVFIAMVGVMITLWVR